MEETRGRELRPERGGRGDDELSLATLTAILLRGRRTVAKLALGAGFLGGLLGLILGREYRANASFIPQETSSSPQGLAGLAGQFGIQIPGQTGEGPEFYHELLTAREVITPLVTQVYEVSDRDGQVIRESLLDLVRIEGDTPEERVDRGVEWVREEALGTSVSRESGIVSLSITTPWPEVSFRMASTLLAQIEAFDAQTRRTQASAEREFLEGRVAEATHELRAAEDELQLFLQQNRRFQNSTELVLQYERFQRQVAMRDRVLTSLLESYEQARIQEVRNTPVITVLEQPALPPRPVDRGIVLKILLGFMLGGTVGLLVAFVRDATTASDNPEMLRLAGAWADTKEDLLRFVPRRAAR